MDRNISLRMAAERVKRLAAIVGQNGVKAVVATLQDTPTGGWISAADRLPYAELDEYLKEYNEIPEFVVMIRGAVVPTALCFDGRSWHSHDGDRYPVTHWMPMPNPPERE